MAVPRTKNKKKTLNTKLFDDARFYLAKTIFPNYMAMVLEATVYELDEILKEHNLEMDQEDKQQFLHNIADRVDKYCTWSNGGVLNPFEMRENFEKAYGIDFRNMYIG